MLKKSFSELDLLLGGYTGHRCNHSYKTGRNVVQHSVWLVGVWLHSGKQRKIVPHKSIFITRERKELNRLCLPPLGRAHAERNHSTLSQPHRPGMTTGRHGREALSTSLPLSHGNTYSVSQYSQWNFGVPEQTGEQTGDLALTRYHKGGETQAKIIGGTFHNHVC